MRITTVALFAVALSAMFLTGCIGLAGMAMAGAAGGPQANAAEPATAAPTAGETAGNVAVQAGAMKMMKGGAVGGPLGYGLVNQAPKLTRSLFGRKTANPKADASQNAAVGG